ncbi:MAG: hypothetical protein IPJ56_07445 [Gemmatimonadetes bacterium]|nr:hypothetical protein [Gemmatimonadota bacterium]
MYHFFPTKDAIFDALRVRYAAEGTPWRPRSTRRPPSGRAFRFRSSSIECSP